MWNCKTLPAPPYCEMKTLLKTSEKGCMLEARKCLKKSEGPTNDHMKLLTAEMYMTKRIIYKLCNQFRSDKALKTLKQVHSCLKRLEGVSIKKQLADCLQLFDSVSSGDEAEYFLPSRQVLEYQLVILQGSGALLCQTAQYCQKTFIHVKQHLELGNMIPQNMIMLALTSRIWYVCNSLGFYISKWYGKLYPCLAIFKSTAVSWLQNEELQEDLSAWLTDLFTDEAFPKQELMNRVEAEKLSGGLPPSVEFLETADQIDLGEPVQRKQFIEEPAGLPDSRTLGAGTTVSSNSKRKFGMDLEKDSSEQAPRKKTQKLSMSDKNTQEKRECIVKTDSDMGDMGKPSASIPYEKSKNKKQINSNLINTVDEILTVQLPEEGTVSVQSVKAHLESILVTQEDFDYFVKQIKSGTCQIHGIGFKFSKSGKKKILKNIDKWKNQMKDKTSSNTEKLFLKKLRGPLSELLVKNSKSSVELDGKKRAMINANQSVDSRNNDILPECSEVNIGINSGQKSFEQQGLDKKKEIKKMKTKINSKVMAKTICLKTDDNSGTVRKTDSFKKRKTKSKNKRK